MKLNKFVCSCGHKFYDSERHSRCDACSKVITIGVSYTINGEEVPLVEEHTGSKIREVTSRGFSDDYTGRKT